MSSYTHFQLQNKEDLHRNSYPNRTWCVDCSAYLTEALLLTITSYTHISTFKENHKLISSRSDAFKIPVAKLTTSKSNLLWEAITRVVRSTDLYSRRPVVIFLSNHLNRPTRKQSVPQQLRCSSTAVRITPRDQEPRVWLRSETESTSSWSGVSVRAGVSHPSPRAVFFQQESPAPGLPNLHHHLSAASRTNSHHIGSLAGVTDTFTVRLALLLPVFRFLHL